MLKLAFTRSHILPVIFGVSMMIFGGCTAAEWGKAATTYDAKIGTPTTQAAMVIGQTAGTIAVAAPGTTAGNIAGIIAAISGLIITVNTVVSGTLHKMAFQMAQNVPPPVAILPGVPAAVTVNNSTAPPVNEAAPLFTTPKGG